MTSTMPLVLAALLQLGGRVDDGEDIGTVVTVDYVTPGTGQAISTLTPAAATNYLFRIENRWTGTYLHDEYVDARGLGVARVGPINPGGPGDTGWWSSYWQLAPADDGQYAIISRWRNARLITDDTNPYPPNTFQLIPETTIQSAEPQFDALNAISFNLVPATIGGVDCYRIVTGNRALTIETDWNNPDLWEWQGFAPYFVTSPPDEWWSTCWILHIYDPF
jgi:hypothetical protein